MFLFVLRAIHRLYVADCKAAMRRLKNNFASSTFATSHRRFTTSPSSFCHNLASRATSHRTFATSHRNFNTSHRKLATLPCDLAQYDVIRLRHHSNSAVLTSYALEPVVDAGC